MSMRRNQRGFTLIEVLIASALMGFSLIVMFGFHNQAVRSNREARKITDCTYLSQLQVEELISLPWTNDSRPSDLEDIMGSDITSEGEPYAWLEHPLGGFVPNPINAGNSDDEEYGEPSYFITWDIEEMDSDATWIRIRVRCQFKDEAFDQWKGTTISTYRFRDT